MESQNIVKTIQKRITAANTNTGIIELFDNTLNAFPEVIAKSAFVKNLKAFSKISSLAPVKLPNFKLEDSESEKLYKTLDVEFNSPRKQLDVFIGSAGNWSQVGGLSLLNPSGYPYRMYNLLDFLTDDLAAELEDGKSIGVQVVDVGYGLLTGEDNITIHGSVTQEYILPVKKNNTSNSFNGIVESVPSLIFDENNNRQYGIIQNIGNNKLTISFESFNEVIFNQGINILPGGYYEFNNPDSVYTGQIYGIANFEEETLVTAVEY